MWGGKIVPKTKPDLKSNEQAQRNLIKTER